MKRILLTGITGFIGGHTARKIMHDHEVTALVRPGTPTSKRAPFDGKVHFAEVDLTNLDALGNYLESQAFDAILHIGALRGGRGCSNEAYHATNVLATERLIQNAIATRAKFVFCSSVGIFGAIPAACPADDSTPRREDNFYHVTKIRSEQLVRKHTASGELDGIILRPAITYGEGDFGFPFTLTKLVDKKLLFFPDRPFQIHLTHIDLISDAFRQAIEHQGDAGKAWIVADETPVVFSELVDFISEHLHQKRYPRHRRVSKSWFEMGEKVAHALKNDLWQARFELISNNWYYDVRDTYRDFRLMKSQTIPNFQIVIDWYRSLQGA